MGRSPGPRTTRRQLLATAAAATSLAGCQTSINDDSDETVTPAPVPEEEVSGETMALRYAGDDPTVAAIDQLIANFETVHEGSDLVAAPLGDATSNSGPTVVYDRIGANLAPRGARLRDLSELWDGERDAYPYGVTVSSFIARSFVVLPQAVHRLNCLYYNPRVLADAGVVLEDYATVSDLRASPGALDSAVETLFAQPLRRAVELLELWESLLAGRLYRERQHVQYVVGDVPDNPLPIRRSLRDLDAALSMLPASAQDATPAALLDGVVDGSVGFVRQPTWVARELVDRPDTTYGTDWAVAPVFASPWTVTFVAWGFAAPGTPSRAATPREVIDFATTPERQRAFCVTARALPARTDVTVDSHPMMAEQAADYRAASMHLPSMAHGIAVRPPVRRRLETALSSFRQHRDVDRGVADLVAALRTARVL